MESDNNSKALELRAVASQLLKLANELDFPSDPDLAQPPASTAAAAPADSEPNPSGERSISNVSELYAEAIFRDRQRRSQFFPTVPFADPAWDLMLDLYFRTSRGEVVTVSNACMAAGVPTTTALRWIDILIDLGHVVREADVADRRRILLKLSTDCHDKLQTYFSQLLSRHAALLSKV